MRAAIYGEIVGAIRESDNLLTFSVKADLPGYDPVNTLVWTEGGLARFLHSERIATGMKVLCMGEMTAKDGFPYLAAEHVAFDIYEEWAQANDY